MGSKLQFSTDFTYGDRASKAEYVWRKYSSILRGGRILDVGADKCYLKRFLPEETSYCGVGFGDVDIKLDLEQEALPFPDQSFDAVLCLDVLEHLERIHSVFDELCRVSNRYVVISLPNPWAGFYKNLRVGHKLSYDPMKFYGLPLEPPPDRHRWFFSTDEASSFLEYRARKNNFQILQMDSEGVEAHLPGTGFHRWLRFFARSYLFRNSKVVANLFGGTLWAVLVR